MVEPALRPGISKSIFLFLGFLFFLSPVIMAQGEPRNQRNQRDHQEPGDTLILDAGQSEELIDTSYHDPKKAVVYSAVLPGLGQIYNKKVWKVPIIYAGFGTFVYFIDRNTRYYKDLKAKLLDSDYELKYFDNDYDYTDDQLTTGKDTYKRWQELSIIGIAGWYALQIIDASVDAYMFDWDVGTDLSLRVEPAGIYTPELSHNALGMRACFTF